MNTPKKFVGLHAHSVLSIGDGLGRPKEHIDFAIENGMDALALTDHGNMDGLADQLFAWEALKKNGSNFKAIPGLESYYIDSLTDWKRMYMEARENGSVTRKKAKKAKGEVEVLQEELAAIGDDSKATEAEIAERYGDDKKAIEEESGSIMENEEESKDYKKFFDPIKQRNHLVLLPKNKQGLMTLFRIVSESYKDGFYKYPRVDLDMLRKYSDGNLIASTACIAGKLASVVAMNLKSDFRAGFAPEMLTENEELIQAELKRVIGDFQEALGVENYYLELQFNKLPLQHIVNYHLMKASKETGAKLIVTCDSHYARPEYWREREIYKAMIWSGKTKGSLSSDNIPKKIDELKCELYPKNAEQVWGTYLEQGKPLGFYEDQTVFDAIERTWSIAHEQIDINVLEIDKKVKLPSIKKVSSPEEIDKAESKVRERKLKSPTKFENPLEVNEEEIMFEILKQHASEGLRKKGLGTNKEYINRLIIELDTIRHLKITSYFLTYEKIMELVSQKMLVAAGRGSACGSLLAYVLGITQVDPIRFGLLFERFLSKKKYGWPDIDSDSSDREYALKVITEYFGEDSVLAISTYGQLQMKSLIRDLGRLYNVPLDEIGEVTFATERESRQVAKGTEAYDGTTWFLTYDEAKLNSPTFNEFLKKYPEIEDSIRVLFKNYRSCFTEGTKLLTDEGEKTVAEILAEKPDMGYLNSFGEVEYNSDYELIVKDEQDVFELELEDGTILELTGDHEVLTQEGYKKVSDLKDTDYMVQVPPSPLLAPSPDS